MQSILFLAIFVALAWIGATLRGILRNTSVVAEHTGRVRHAIEEGETVQRLSDIGLRLDDLTTVVAYWAAEHDSPLSGLYGEPDYALEKDRIRGPFSSVKVFQWGRSVRHLRKLNR